MPIPVALGMLAAGAAVTGGQMGASAAMQNTANKKNYHYQTSMQNKINYDQMVMNKYNQQLAMQTFDKTGMPAQRRQLEKAGLNPALLYGGSGAGGGTVAMPSSSASEAGAPDMTAMLRAGSQQGLLDQAMKLAQIKNIEANTENTKEDTENKAGSERENTIADTAVKKADARIKEVAATVSETTSQEQIETIKNEMNKTYGQALQEIAAGNTADKTKQEAIEQVRANLIQKYVEIENKQANTNLTQAQTKEVNAKIDKIVKEIETMDIRNSQEAEKIAIQKAQQEFNTSTPAQIKQWTSIVTDILNATKGGGTTTVNKTNYGNDTQINNIQ